MESKLYLVMENPHAIPVVDWAETMPVRIRGNFSAERRITRRIVARMDVFPIKFISFECLLVNTFKHISYDTRKKGLAAMFFQMDV